MRLPEPGDVLGGVMPVTNCRPQKRVQTSVTSDRGVLDGTSWGGCDYSKCTNLHSVWCGLATKTITTNDSCRRELVREDAATMAIVDFFGELEARK